MENQGSDNQWKSTTIVNEDARIYENSDRKVIDQNNILTERMAKFQSGGKTGDLGNKKILGM